MLLLPFRQRPYKTGYAFRCWAGAAPIFIVSFLCSLSLTLLANFVSAGDSELKAGDTIGPHNWQRVEGMVGQNLLNRIKQGYTFQIKQGRPVSTPIEFTSATEQYSGHVRLAPSGELLNYVAGLPFPEINATDPNVAFKIAWNFYWRWLGDDYKTGGGTGQGKIIRYAIEKDGSERRSNTLHHTIKTRGRVTLSPKPAVPGYEHIDWMQLRADEYPRDTAGTTTLEIRYSDPKRE